MSFETDLEQLKEGNKRFVNAQSNFKPIESIEKLKNYAENGQTPKAIILCCSDSRAPVEMIFDQGLGDLFVIRIAGNIVAPSIIGSIEFAINAFGTQLVVVMGHTQCGAITATLNHIENLEMPPSENLHSIISRIKPHIYPVTIQDNLSREEKIDVSVTANVKASVAQLASSSRNIEELLVNKKIKIVGSVLNLKTGKVSFFDN